MPKLLTPRLKLIPLTYQQLIILSKDRNSLEKSMELKPSLFELSDDGSFLKEFYHALGSYTLPQVRVARDRFEWFTHWLIVDRIVNITVGGIGCAGLPDRSGQVMIGYFTDKKFEGRGYASEAVESLTNWIFENPSVRVIVADTLSDAPASQKVLQKNGFKPAGTVEEGLRWKLDRY